MTLLQNPEGLSQQTQGRAFWRYKQHCILLGETMVYAYATADMCTPSDLRSSQVGVAVAAAAQAAGGSGCFGRFKGPTAFVGLHPGLRGPAEELLGARTAARVMIGALV